MSEFKVCFTKVREVSAHGNADALEIITVYGFQVVARKDTIKVGDFVLYCPIDAVLPQDLESIVFPEGSKIKLHNSRVKQIRIRNFPSQGMLLSVSDIKKMLESRGLKSDIDFKLEHDYKELFGIQKYEPPVPEFQKPGEKGGRKVNPLTNPQFHSYNGLENIKWFPDLFKDGEEVIIQEKLHGTNARAGMLKTSANTLFKKFLKLIRLLPEYEFCYGSNNVELTNRIRKDSYYGEDVYGRVFKEIGAEKKILPNEIIYGEIIGEGIQKNYDYGLKGDKREFVLFDVKIIQPDGSFIWLTPEETQKYAAERGFLFVPVLYRGKYNLSLARELTVGNSVYCPSQKIREGIVIKSKLGYNDSSCSSKKKALKLISEAYLDKDQTDFH